MKDYKEQCLQYVEEEVRKFNDLNICIIGKPVSIVRIKPYPDGFEDLFDIRLTIKLGDVEMSHVAYDIPNFGFSSNPEVYYESVVKRTIDSQISRLMICLFDSVRDAKDKEEK